MIRLDPENRLSIALTGQKYHQSELQNNFYQHNLNFTV